MARAVVAVGARAVAAKAAEATEAVGLVEGA